MNVTHVHIENFRSYTTLDFDVSPNTIQIFYGNNGVGKTNILEALLFCSLTKSPRIDDESLALHWGQDYCRIAVEFTDNSLAHHNIVVGFQVQPRKKKILEYDSFQMPAREFIGKFPSVSFFPDDLELFTGAPQRRRRFLDQLLCQVSPTYTTVLLEYQKVIQQRNAALRCTDAEYSVAAIDVWNEPIAMLGARIIFERQQLLKHWNDDLSIFLQKLGEISWNEVSLHYQTKVYAKTYEAIKDELCSLLTQRLPLDKIRKSTSVGPHRDDFFLEIDGHELSRFASRGQQRTAVLALLLLQEKYIFYHKNVHPIILLDDVFSELDDTHQGALLELLSHTQVWITTAQLPLLTKKATVWEVSPGKVMQR